MSKELFKNYLLLLLPILAILASGCRKDNTETGNPIQVGKFYAGGYIFYIDASGQHGMVMAPAEAERALPWGCYGTLVDIGGNIVNNLGWGEYCTRRMVYKCNEVSAAGRYCYDLESGGYQDWCLPNINEWLLAYKELGVNTAVNVKPNIHYWVSAEADANRGTYCISSNVSGAVFEIKTAFNLVRAVRSF